MIKIKRVYEKPLAADGARVLVDRLWPRGIAKAALKLDSWEKDLAPSTSLRQWFGHDPKRWPEFKKRYRTELKAKKAELAALRARAKKGNVTLLYGAKDESHNNAVALRDVLQGTRG